MKRIDGIPALSRDPGSVQGGDLTHLPEGLVTLNLSLCTNRLGPPPAALDALRDFLDHHSDRLMPPAYEAPRPPFRAERSYLQAFADWLEVEEQYMLAGRGVTEFLVILGRLLQLSRVAVITPEYTETMKRFSYASFAHPEDAEKDTPESRMERVRGALRDHEFVILSNPSNPLGHYIPRDELLDACRANPHSVLIVDEEYIAFEPDGSTLAGADVTNLVVLQSTGKTFGITGTRAGMLWTRHARLYDRVRSQLPAWPLSLLDIVLASAALRDRTWIGPVLSQITEDGRRLEHMLTGCFGSAAVVPSMIHYRFVHLSDPYPALEHLHTHGITARLFAPASRGGVPGLRLVAPSTDQEFEQVRDALATMPPEGRLGSQGPPAPAPYAGKWVLEPGGGPWMS